jgi:hypothetical protein
MKRYLFMAFQSGLASKKKARISYDTVHWGIRDPAVHAIRHFSYKGTPAIYRIYLVAILILKTEGPANEKRLVQFRIGVEHS